MKELTITITPDSPVRGHFRADYSSILNVEIGKRVCAQSARNLTVLVEDSIGNILKVKEGPDAIHVKYPEDFSKEQVDEIRGYSKRADGISIDYAVNGQQ